MGRLSTLLARAEAAISARLRLSGWLPEADDGLPDIGKGG